MTDKEQIMIDGVDVNRCIDFNKRDKVSCYHILYDKCNESPNCYFKQLARKTRECEKLKIQLMQKSEVDMFFNTPIEGWSNDPCGICPHKAENEELKEENQELRNSLSGSLMFRFTSQDKEVARYRKALEEIEGLIQSTLDDFEEDGIDQQLEFSKQIGMNVLDIINKAK